MRRTMVLTGLGVGFVAVVLLLGPVVGAGAVDTKGPPPPPPSSQGPPLPTSAQPVRVGVIHNPKFTDLAPQVPATKKFAIVIRHSDGAYEAYLMPGDQVRDFTQHLRAGDTWVNTFPPTPLTAPHGP
jgi:hypothetical protein